MNFITLNEEQQRAIQHGEGPLLIIAGAGTGKTQVITGRILYLIEGEKVPPQSILALTFTEKATQEMMERVEAGLPPGHHELWIKTFHSFCDAILRERGLEIGLPTNYKILSGVEPWLLFKKNLFKFPLKTLRPLGNPTKCITALLEHFSRLKDENISPEIYLEHGETVKDEKIIEIAQCYKTYQELLIQEALLDFGDLQGYALQLFKKRPKILEEYQNRFQYILVDEFQDTNYAQNKMLQYLAQKHQNITVVGDDDQSIYKWRGASLTNILHFENSFPNAKKIVLKQNYRSTENILNLAYNIIQNNNPHRLEIQKNINKKLIPMSGMTSKSTKIIHARDGYEEAEMVIQEIKRLNENEQVSYGDCAILVRAKSHSKAFIEEMKRHNLPYQYFGNEGLLSREEIKDLLSIIRIISNPNDDIALFRILTFDIWQLSMETILTLMDKAKRNLQPLYFELKNSSKKLIQTKEEEGLQKAGDVLKKLIESSRKKTVSQIIGEFLQISQYIKAIEAEESHEAYEKIQGIAQFSELVKQFEANNPDGSVINFAEYIKLLEESGEKGNQQCIPNLEEERIKILTIHASKGLEFPYVFLVNLVNERFPAKNQRDPFEIPKSLIQESLPGENTHIEEERRLCYVACTRAKKGLYLCYSDSYENGKKLWKKSIFLEEAEKTNLTTPLSPEETIKKERIHRSLSNHRELLRSIPEINIAKLSFSQMDTFETCPHKYKLQYLWKVPQFASHAMSFGSSMHNTLRSFYELMKKTKKPLNKETLFKLYEKNWIAGGYLSKSHETTRKQKGREILSQYFDTNEKHWIIPEYLEQSFFLRIDNTLFSGRIDRIDKIDNEYEVIDYKTGAIRKESEVQKDLQLSIYALACRDILKIPVTKFSLYFLEEGKKISSTRTEDDIEKTREKLQEMAQNMRNSDFEATPSYMCQFCDYRIVCYAV